jgi:ankyrin repeat protein
MKKLIFTLTLAILSLSVAFADEFNVTIFVKNSTDEDIRHYIYANPEQINRQYEPSNETFLISAVISGRYNLVKFLLENGADPNLTSVAGGSPLSFSAGMGNFKMVKLLLDFSADPNIRANGRFLPLMASVCELNFASVRSNDYFANALKVIDLLAPKTLIDNDDFLLPERTIQSEINAELKTQKAKLLEIIRTKVISHKSAN